MLRILFCPEQEAVLPVEIVCFWGVAAVRSGVRLRTPLLLQHTSCRYCLHHYLVIDLFFKQFHVERRSVSHFVDICPKDWLYVYIYISKWRLIQYMGSWWDGFYAELAVSYRREPNVGGQWFFLSGGHLRAMALIVVEPAMKLLPDLTHKSEVLVLAF